MEVTTTPIDAKIEDRAGTRESILNGDGSRNRKIIKFPLTELMAQNDPKFDRKVWKRFSVSLPTDELIKQRAFWSNEYQKSGWAKFGIDNFIDHLAGADRRDGRARVGKFDKQLLKAIIKLTSQQRGNLLNHDRAVCIQNNDTGERRLAFRVKVKELLKMAGKKATGLPSEKMWERFSRILREQGYIGLGTRRTEEVNRRKSKTFWVTELFLWINQQALNNALFEFSNNPIRPATPAIAPEQALPYCHTVTISPSGSSSSGDHGDSAHSGDKKPDSQVAAGAAPGGESKHQGGFAPLDPPARTIGDMPEARFVYRMASKSISEIDDIYGVTSMPAPPELLEAQQKLPHADQLYCFTKSGQLDVATRQILSALDHVFNRHLPDGQLRITNGLLESLKRLRSPRLGEATLTRDLLQKFQELAVCEKVLPFWMTIFEEENAMAPANTVMTLEKFLQPKVWITIARAINNHFNQLSADEAAYELKEIEMNEQMLHDLIDDIMFDPDAFWQKEFKSGGRRQFAALRDQPDSLPAMVLYGLVKGWKPTIMDKLRASLRNFFTATPDAAVYFHTTRSIIDWVAVSGMNERFCQAVTDKAEATIREWKWIAREETRANLTPRPHSKTAPSEKSRDRGGYLPVEAE